MNRLIQTILLIGCGLLIGFSIKKAHGATLPHGVLAVQYLQCSTNKGPFVTVYKGVEDDYYAVLVTGVMMSVMETVEDSQVETFYFDDGEPVAPPSLSIPLNEIQDAHVIGAWQERPMAQPHYLWCSVNTDA